MREEAYGRGRKAHEHDGQNDEADMVGVVHEFRHGIPHFNKQKVKIAVISDFDDLIVPLMGMSRR